MSKLVKEGITALREGRNEEARRMFSRAIRDNPGDETAWMAMAAATKEPAHRRDCLERVLHINPDNRTAKRELEKINRLQENPSKPNRFAYVITGAAGLLLFAIILVAGISWLNRARGINSPLLALGDASRSPKSTSTSLPTILPTNTIFPTIEPTSTFKPTATEVTLVKSNPQSKTFSFEYGCQEYTVTLPLYKSVYDYYTSQEKSLSYWGTPSEDWEKHYYTNFIEMAQDREIINDLTRTITENLDIKEDDELVLALTSLVQNIEYNCDKSFSYQNLDDHGYETNFPYETLYKKTGVCGDTSILLGKLLKRMGYGTAFLIYEETNHMAVGIECPVETANYTLNGKGYCYIETTTPTRIGIKPDKSNGEAFDETQEIIVISDGKSFNKMNALYQKMREDVASYGEEILYLSTCEEITRYKDLKNMELVLEDYDQQLEALQLRLEQYSDDINDEISQFKAYGCQGTLPPKKYNECVDWENQIDAMGEFYNELFDEYNALLAERNDYYSQYTQAYQSFEALLDRNAKSCVNVSTEPITKQEKSE